MCKPKQVHGTGQDRAQEKRAFMVMHDITVQFALANETLESYCLNKDTVPKRLLNGFLTFETEKKNCKHWSAH